MKVIKVGNALVRIPNEDSVDVIKFEWDSADDGKTNYYIKIYYNNATVTNIFLGYEKETAKTLYDNIVSMIFKDIETLAQ